MVRRRSERQTLFAALAAAVAAVVGWLALAFTGAVAMPLGLRPALALAELAFVLPTLGSAWLAGRLRELAGQGATPRLVPRALAAGAALWITSLGLMDTQARLWPPPTGYLEMFRSLHALLRPAGALDALVSLAVIALIPALCEELVFRGLVLPSFSAWRGPAVGLVVSTALFGAIHMDQVAGAWTAYRVPFALAVGLGFGLLRLASGSLLAPVLAHAALNSLTFGAVPLFDEPAQETTFAHPAIGVSLALVGVAGVAWLVRGFARGARGAGTPGAD